MHTSTPTYKHTYQKQSLEEEEEEGEREASSSSCHYRWHNVGHRCGCGVERWCPSGGPVCYHLVPSSKRKCQEQAATWKNGNESFGWNRTVVW